MRKSKDHIRIIERVCQIVYEHGNPHGIRDATGFLFFFAPISKYAGQEERYRQELEQQLRLADSLLAYLRPDKETISVPKQDLEELIDAARVAEKFFIATNRIHHATELRVALAKFQKEA